MATREENIQKIRTAVYGKDVREAIAEGMEQTYVQCEDMSIVTAGGTMGQVLAKRSNADWDTEWIDPEGGGGGGTAYTFTDANHDGNIVIAEGGA